MEEKTIKINDRRENVFVYKHKILYQKSLFDPDLHLKSIW